MLEKNNKSNQQKQSHFRTWKSGKKWLYGAATLVLLSAIGNANLQDFSHGRTNLAYAATSSTQTLVPGSTAVSPPDYTANNNTVASSPTSSYTQWKSAFYSAWLASSTTLLQDTSAGAYKAFTQDGSSLSTNSNSSVLIGNPVDMSQSVTFSTGIKTTRNLILGNNTTNIGQFSGILLMPMTTTSLSGRFNAMTLGGISNTYFFGRPFNSTMTGLTANINNYIIAGTGSSTTASVYAQNNDVYLYTTGGTQPVGDVATVTWTPTSTDLLNSTVTGTFTLTMLGGSSANSTIAYSNAISYTATVPRNMVLGVTAAGTSGVDAFAGQIQLNPRGMTATTGSEPIIIKYQNSSGSMVTGSSAWGPTSLIAKLNDTIGVVAPGVTINDSNTYDYTAPAASGYAITQITGQGVGAVGGSSSGAVVVSDFSASVGGVNYITVNYSALPESAIFSYSPATALSTGSMLANSLQNSQVPASSSSMITGLTSGNFIGQVPPSFSTVMLRIAG